MKTLDTLKRASTGMAGVSAIYFASRILPAAISLLSIKVFYAQLGSTEYGRYVILNSLVLMSSNVGATWLGQSVLRYRSQYETPSELASHEAALRIGAVGSSLLACLGVAIFLAIRGTPILTTLLVGGALSSLLWYSVLAVAAQADMKPTRFFVAEALRSVGTFSIALLLLFSVAQTAQVPIAAMCIGNVAGILAYRWRVAAVTEHTVVEPVVSNDPSGQVMGEIRRYARYGVPMILWMLVSVLINTADRFVVEAVLGAEQLGIYAAITDLTYKTAIVILMPLGIAFHPVIMAAWNAGDSSAAYRAIRLTIASTVGVGSVLLLGFGLGASALQRFATGSVVGGGTALVIMGAAAAVLWQLGVVIQKPLEMHDRTRSLAGLAAFGWIGQLVVLTIFLPRVGIVAASAGLLLASGVYVALVTAASMRLAPRRQTSGASPHSDRDL